ncbi:Modification methylase DpnIIB [subsurface metagenome]|jgi:DNA modification methylase
MKPYYQDKWVTIYLGDCREILPELPNSSVGLMITDPPYGIGKAEWDYVDFRKLLSELRDEFMRLSVEGGLGFIWFPKKEIYKLDNLGFSYDVFIETKNFAQKRATDILIDCWCPILMLRKGDYARALDREGCKNWFMINTANTADNVDNPRMVKHPTAKDMRLSEYIISGCSKRGEVVLDPYLGSGTTAWAAKKLNRKCIGIETKEEYCETAANRCRQTVMELGI